MALHSQIKTLENKISKDKDKLAALRRKAPLQPVADYLVWNGKKKVKLSSLFGKKKEMILVHNMGSDCPYCALWADGFNGMLKHLEDRASFVVENDDTPAVQAKTKKARGWDFTFVSSEGSSLKEDLGFKDGEDYAPGVSTLIKKPNGKLFRLAHTYFGPGDNYCSLWDLFDLLPEAEWGAKFQYSKP
jgi:predicted dithiol-disulfide oxidoreductase (DUF899 family)